MLEERQARANELCPAAMELAEEVGLIPLQVARFASANHVCFLTAVLRMIAARAAKQ